MQSAFYFGELRHRHFSPCEHRFTYPVFMVFLDELPRLMRVTTAIHWEALKLRAKHVSVYAHQRKLARQGACISKGQLSG